MELRNIPSNVSMEEALEGIRTRAGTTNPNLLPKLIALRSYIADVVDGSEKRWSVGHKDATNQLRLFSLLEDWRERMNEKIRVVTFNYDHLAERAVQRATVGLGFGALPTYIKADSHRVYKLHGSVDWWRQLTADVINSGRSKRTAQYIHSVLHRALGQAARQGLVARNVADFVELPRVERHEVAVLDPGQARQFERAASEDPNEGLYVLAITTGMRQSELLGLRWRDVDLERGFLSVTNTLVKPGRCPVFGPPKTRKSRRRINLTDKAINALQRLRARQAKCRLKGGGGKWAEFGLVFTNRCGGPMDGTNLTERGFRRLLTRAGLPRIRFHDLRHTAATLLLIKGVHPKVVADILGHSSVAVTLDVYSHVLEGLQEEAVAALNEVFA